MLTPEPPASVTEDVQNTVERAVRLWQYNDNTKTGLFIVPSPIFDAVRSLALDAAQPAQPLTLITTPITVPPPPGAADAPIFSMSRQLRQARAQLEALQDTLRSSSPGLLLIAQPFVVFVPIKREAGAELSYLYEVSFPCVFLNFSSRASALPMSTTIPPAEAERIRL